MTRTHLARTWFGATALAVLVGLVVQLTVVGDASEGFFTSTAARYFNVFCFFTIQSNIVGGVTCALLALGPTRDSTLFGAFRLAGLTGITITFVVFHVALSDLHDLEGSAAVADFLLHTASPVLCVAGWLLFGPRGRVSWTVVGYALLFPVAWLAFTLVRGPIVDDYYPYPFLDVATHGYARVLLNVVVVALLFLAVSAAALWLDRRLGRLGRRDRVQARA